MSTVSPLIADWIANKLEYKYVWQPIRATFPIPAGQSIRTDPGEYKSSEGVFITGGWVFDHPMCGVRLEAGPSLDTGRFFRVAALITFGSTSPNNIIYCNIPPTTPPGVYVLSSTKEWSWVRFLKFHVFNDDTVVHTCLGFGFTLGLLDKPRPTPSREIEEAILASQQEMLNLIKGGRPV